MQAVLLATGETHKLWPLTESVPSPLIKIANQPLIEMAIAVLTRHGIKSIIACLFHQASSIEREIGNGERWGAQMNYVLVREAFGNAGVLQRVRPLISGDFLVMPADAIVDFNLAEAIDFHRCGQRIATAVVSDFVDPQYYVAAPGEIRAHQPGAPAGDLGRTYYETGVYLFSAGIFQYIPEQTPYDIHAQLLPALAQAGQPVGAYVMDGYWNRLENFRDLQEAQKIYLHSALDGGADAAPNRYPDPSPFVFTQQYQPGVWIGKNNSIHPSARLSGPVLLGDNIRIDRGVILGPDVVVGANVIVSEDATVRHSTIFEDTFIGRLVNVENRLVDKNLVIDINTSDYLRVDDRFLLRPAPRSLEHTIYRRILEAAGALGLLLLAIPLAAMIAVLLKLLTGKALVSLPRIYHGLGRNSLHPGQPAPVFQLYHFHTRTEDGRLTPYGRLLERFELHRIPELWNVIRGDLRLVGVKPLSPEQAAQLQEEWQRRHNEYFPGITGLWYLETDADSNLNDVLLADVLYVVTRGHRLDIEIVLKSPRAWLRRVGLASKNMHLPEEFV